MFDFFFFVFLLNGWSETVCLVYASFVLPLSHNKRPNFIQVIFMHFHTFKKNMVADISISIFLFYIKV